MIPYIYYIGFIIAITWHGWIHNALCFLLQLEITKTSDNKLTFLHVLAEAVFNKFPDLVAVGEELTTVPEAAKCDYILLLSFHSNNSCQLLVVSYWLIKLITEKIYIILNNYA